GTESNEKYALYNAQVVQLVRKQTAVVNDLIAKAEPLVADEKTAYDAAVLLYKAQLGMPKNKKLMTLLQEAGGKSAVQRVELDRLADRKLPARDQKMRDVEDDLYFVMDERGRSVHLTDKGVETMSPQDATLFGVPDISHAVHEIDHDEALSDKEKVERRRDVESEHAQKSEALRIIHELLQAHARYEKDVEYGVLVGTVSVDVSETLSRMIKRRGLKHEVLNAKQHQREAEIVAQAGQPGSITIATNMAGRGTDIKLGPGVKRCQVCGITSHEPAFGQQVEQPDLTQPEIKKLGCYDDPPCGLVIIGTERHEARRIDRQLRGRSGRQGDPGQSVFFLALEDDLMRLFGSDRIARWMDRTGAEEGEVITHPWVTGAIGQAQKRVELQHFQARKKLLEYDDVMNQQREVIYSLRQFALEGGEELKAEALHMVEAAVERLADGLVAEFDDPAQWDRALFETEFLQKFLISVPGVTDPTVIHNRDDLVRAAQQAARDAF